MERKVYEEVFKRKKQLHYTNMYFAYTDYFYDFLLRHEKRVFCG